MRTSTARIICLRDSLIATIIPSRPFLNFLKALQYSHARFTNSVSENCYPRFIFQLVWRKHLVIPKIERAQKGWFVCRVHICKHVSCSILILTVKMALQAAHRVFLLSSVRSAHILLWHTVTWIVSDGHRALWVGPFEPPFNFSQHLLITSRKMVSSPAMC